MPTAIENADKIATRLMPVAAATGNIGVGATTAPTVSISAEPPELIANNTLGKDAFYRIAKMHCSGDRAFRKLHTDGTFLLKHFASQQLYSKGLLPNCCELHFK